MNLTDEMFSGVYRGKRAHDDDRALVLRRAREVGVTDAIVTAGTLEEAREVVEMVRERERSGEDATGTPRLRATCGVHPTRCGAFDADVDGADGHLEKLRAVAMDGTTDGTIVAIGELGLDYDRLEFCDAETQKRMFEKQFALSEATGLPLFLHMRAAREDFLEIIARNRHRFTEGVVHSFTGSAEDARAVLAVDGLHIGVNGCSLKTQENLDVVRDIPLERMCLETDAPWCGIKRTHAGFEHVSSRVAARRREKGKVDPRDLRQGSMRTRPRAPRRPDRRRREKHPPSHRGRDHVRQRQAHLPPVTARLVPALSRSVRPADTSTSAGNEIPHINGKMAHSILYIIR